MSRTLPALCLLICAIYSLCLPLPLMAAHSPSAADQKVEVRDSVTIYFKVGKSNYDPTLRNNRATLDAYLNIIRNLEREGRLTGITVEGYVSPEGPTAVNERLAVQRSRVLADIIARDAGVNPSKIKTEAAGVSWSELRRLIATRPNVPSRSALLDIIDKTPIWVFDKKGNIIGGRKKSLMDLRGGQPYKWLLINIFPELRNATGIALSYSALPPEEPEQQAAEPAADSSLNKEEEMRPYLEETPPAEVDQPIEVITPKHDPLHALALKTNMLYDAILLPNLELEWYINNKWSVALEGNVAWWGKYSKNRSYRLVMISPEVRYWIKQKALRKGFFVGATAGAGYYDLLKNRPGYYGEGVMAGVTGGYQWPISRNLSLEAELGLGYMYSRVKEYEPIDNHHVYQRTKEINYFGPIKLELSLVWRFLDKNKRKKDSGK